MKLIEALENALSFIEAGGVTGGDVHDDLANSITIIKTNFKKTANVELPDTDDGFVSPLISSGNFPIGHRLPDGSVKTATGWETPAQRSDRIEQQENANTDFLRGE